MEQRADVNDVGVGVARLGDRLIEPVAELLALLRRVDVLVVLQIVADNKVGTPLLVTSATDFLARADCLNLDAVGQQDDRGLPDLAFQLAEVFLQGSVLLQLRLDVDEEALGLFRAVREDDDVVLVAVDGGVQVVLEGEGRALGMATRRFDRTAAPIRAADPLGVHLRVHPLQHALPPYPVQLAVELGRRADEVVREIGPPEVFKIEGSELPAQSLRPGQFLSDPEVLKELRPLLGKVAVLCDVLLEQLPLIRTVCDRFPVFRLCELFEVVVQVNLRHLPAPSLLHAPARREARQQAQGAA